MAKPGRYPKPAFGASFRLGSVAPLCLALLVASCGGGGGGGSQPPAPSSPLVAPQISQQPGGRAVAVGANVGFSVGVFGSSSSFQWRRNGVDIPGATAASYTLASASLGDDGARFSVIVANTAGSDASTDAVLTVFPLPAATVTCTIPGAAASAFADSSAAAGKASGALIAGCTGAVTDPVWTQTAGPAVALLSDKSQVISFEPPSAGTYSFQVAFTDPMGAAATRTLSTTAAAAAGTSTINARLDRAVHAGGNASIRAWPQLVPGDSVRSLRWTQLEGPAVSLDTRDPARILFTAPGVMQDTLLRFRVTMTTGFGITDSDDVSVLVENYAQVPASATDYVFRDLHVSRVHPYRATGPYAAQLVRCVYDAMLQWQGAGKNLCSLSTLPYLHQETTGNEPSVDQIMSRVLVSHDWMGDVFQQFITGDDKSELRRLLNAVTAVVIGANLRPGFYHGVTGAIYMDADDFWLTPEQRDVIDEAPDFRSAFDRELAYSTLWRYTLNNVNVFRPFPSTLRVSRDVSYLLYETGWLMYHELAHANDFLPFGARASLVDSASPWDNVRTRYAAQQLTSDFVAQQFPLNSAEMKQLAQVKFFGATPDAMQRAYTPAQVWGYFSADRASDEYSYATTREDAAMLFEEFMMAYRHGIRRDTAFTDKVTPSSTGASVLVRGGQRGRIGDTAIKPRLEVVLQGLAPWILNADAGAITRLPAPIPMRAGESWNDNVALPAPLAGSARAPSAISAEEDAALLRRATRRLMERPERLERIKK